MRYAFLKKNMKYMMTILLVMMICLTSFGIGLLSVSQVSAETEIIIDNADAECSFGGSWVASTNSPGYYGANYAHDNTYVAEINKLIEKNYIE